MPAESVMLFFARDQRRRRATGVISGLAIASTLAAHGVSAHAQPSSRLTLPDQSVEDDRAWVKAALPEEWRFATSSARAVVSITTRDFEASEYPVVVAGIRTDVRDLIDSRILFSEEKYEIDCTASRHRAVARTVHMRDQQVRDLPTLPEWVAIERGSVADAVANVACTLGERRSERN